MLPLVQSADGGHGRDVGNSEEYSVFRAGAVLFVSHHHLFRAAEHGVGRCCQELRENRTQAGH